MKLLNFTAPELAFARLAVPDRVACLRHMVERLREIGRIREPEILLSELLAREEVETTGIGQGIAIPHARSDTVLSSVVMIATLAEPIDFNAVDGEPVDLILLLAGSRELPGEQLRVLARISKLVRLDGFLADLRGATSPAEIVRAVQAAEARHF
jgi:mannitol/fructose-specific phosphotransferase system IIA component (Ntr-type)